ncbi:MAG TPA: aspartyl/asparaginyl beta-hydroxylase domain-containing protein [Gammaproteobacteria bacterium]|nr:aspartyl/asparaginyl beta-hydroxylase domain-containing protein [Gammaproteobacteria bacterium]
MNQPRTGQANAAWQVQTLADSAKQLAERGELRQAEQIYRQILEVAPYHVRSLNFLAVQALERGELDQSQSFLEQALRAAPDRPILHQNLGLVHRRRGESDKALAALERAIALKPAHRTAWLHKGAVLEDLGRHDEAVRAYWQAWLHFPDADAVANDSFAAPALRDLVMQAAEGIRATQLKLIADALAPVHEKHGPEALKRVDEAAEIYVGRRPPRYQHGLQHPSFIYLPGLAPRPFFERAEFPWAPALEAATATIREELRAVLASGEGIAPYVQVQAGTAPQQWAELDGSKQWSSFHLCKAGERIETNLARCPKTAAALAALPLPEIPGHAPEALFSVLQPGTHIPPHFGLANYKIVVHLPLIVPADCAIRVGNETRGWKEGECLLLDDSFQHEAWNRSQELRAVLITEVWHPDLTAAEREGIAALVAGISAFNRSYGGAA